MFFHVCIVIYKLYVSVCRVCVCVCSLLIILLYIIYTAVFYIRDFSAPHHNLKSIINIIINITVLGYQLKYPNITLNWPSETSEPNNFRLITSRYKFFIFIRLLLLYYIVQGKDSTTRTQFTFMVPWFIIFLSFVSFCIPR